MSNDPAILVEMATELGALRASMEAVQADVSEMKTEVKALTAARHKAWGVITGIGLMAGGVGAYLPEWLQHLLGAK